MWLSLSLLLLVPCCLCLSVSADGTFPLQPVSYSTTVSVTSSLRAEVSTWTEYFDLTLGLLRRDGAYGDDLDEIEICDINNGTAIRFNNSQPRAGALGFQARADYLTAQPEPEELSDASLRYSNVPVCTTLFYSQEQLALNLSSSVYYYSHPLLV